MLPFDQAIKKFVKEFPSLKEKLESNSDDNNLEELKREAELLANETGFTFWYVNSSIPDDDYCDTSWKVFVPNHIQDEKLLEYYWDFVSDGWISSEENLSEWRFFLWGESQRAHGQWVTSYSC